MDTVADLRPCVLPDFKPSVEGFAETKRPSCGDIDDLIALVRGNEDNVFSYARDRSIDPLTLRSRLLLHLPRFVGDSLPSKCIIQQEMLAVSDGIEDIQRTYTKWLKPPETPIALGDLEFISLDEETAKIFHECFHYIGSYRPGQHFAFRDKTSGRIVCIGSLAPLDLGHAEEKIAPNVDPRSVFMLSRFFSFRWAPEKTFSHFHGKLRLRLIKDFDTKLMLSFVNPNLGFNASSYKSANWTVFARENATRYMYLDGRYRTMRFFVNNHGTSDTDQLRKKLGPSFQVSTLNLHPMLLLAIPLQRRARKAIPPKPFIFERPVL